MIFFISASQKARIIGWSHHAWSSFVLKYTGFSKAIHAQGEKILNLQKTERE
jgi:hypothetical protein